MTSKEDMSWKVMGLNPGAGIIIFLEKLMSLWNLYVYHVSCVGSSCSTAVERRACNREVVG